MISDEHIWYSYSNFAGDFECSNGIQWPQTLTHSLRSPNKLGPLWWNKNSLARTGPLSPGPQSSLGVTWTIRSLQIPWRDVAQEAVSSLASWQLTRRIIHGFRDFQEGLIRFYWSVFFKCLGFSIVELGYALLLDISFGDSYMATPPKKKHKTLTMAMDGPYPLRCLDSEISASTHGDCFDSSDSLRYEFPSFFWFYRSCFGESSWVTYWLR